MRFGLLVVLVVTLFHGTIEPALGEDANIEFDGQSRIQEFVVVTRNIDLMLPTFTDILKWTVIYEGDADKTVALSWELATDTPIREVLVGNDASEYGFVRLVEIQGVEQAIIRPGARWWDTGGMMNINVLVKDSSVVIAGLRRLGWTTRALPESYEWPGGLKGVSAIMIGPEDLMLSFQERQSPPLTGWPEFSGATHIEVGYERANDPATWSDFYKNEIGFKTRDLSTRGSNENKEVGPNDFGLPHNATNLDYSILGGAIPHDGEQLIGVRSFPNATGYDFSDRAHPPNIGIASVRLPVSDLDTIAERIQKSGIALASDVRIVDMKPYGKVKMLAYRSPGGSGQWTELFEPRAEPMTGTEFSTFLQGGKSGTWSGVGGASGKIYFNADGSAKVTFARGEAVGTWALKGNAICTSWTTLRDGRESCAVYYYLKNKDYQSFQMNGQVEGFTTFD